VCETFAFPGGIAHKMPSIDRLYKIAEGQAGYFAAAQARVAGYSWESLSRNVKNGTFERISHGIYRLSRYPRDPREDLYIAWLKVGPKSVVSHDSALEVYDLGDVLPSEIHIIMPRSSSRRRQGIRIHTCALKPEEIVRRDGLPLTSVERTIADAIRAGMPEDQVRDVIRDAFQRGLSTPERMRKYSVQRGGRMQRILRSYLKGRQDEIR
jgi:predicted transcriptional regulator of viral defense system